MSIFDSPLLKAFRNEAQQRERIVLLPDHIFPAPVSAEPVLGGKGYFRLWLSEMFLKRDRDWGRTLYPVVQSLTTFRFGSPAADIEFAQVAGPSHLASIDQAHLDRVVQLDYALTPLVPYSGGTVQVETGLIATKADDMLKRFLDVMSSFSSLLNVPQLSSVLGIAETVSKGMEQLLGVTDKELVLGYEQTFADGGGGNQLRSGYIAVVDAPRGTLAPAQVWVKDGALLTGPDLAGAQPLTGVHYMLMRLETSPTRSDWPTLGTISEPLNKATNLMAQIDATGMPNFKGAEGFILQAIAAAWTTPDLIEDDRKRVAAAIKARYKEQKEVFSLESGERSLALPSVTGADVAQAAAHLDTQAVAAVTFSDLVTGL
jgi:hypothetical protein